MKKFFLILGLLLSFNLQVLAVCSITGEACSINNSYTQNDTAQDLLNNIQNNRTESYNNQYIKNFNNPEWNTPLNNQINNSNCQFGICPPQSNQINRQ